MELKVKGFRYLFYGCFAFSGSICAGTMGMISPQSANHIELIGALGVASLTAGSSYLSVSSSETDRLVQTSGNGWNNFTGQIGIGYLYYLHGAQQYAENVQWFPSIAPAINNYFINQNHFKGDVWRFSDPKFNQMTYNIPIDSYRLMFDAALTVVSKKQFSLYAKGGLGNAWNRVGYSDAERNGTPCAVQNLNFNSTTNSKFAWEAGAGLSYTLNHRVALSLEYLYTDLGKVSTPANGFTGAFTTPTIVPATFNLTSQAALLGLHVSL